MVHDYLLFGKRELAELERTLEVGRVTWAKEWLSNETGGVRCLSSTEEVSNQARELWYAKPASGIGLYIQSPAGFSKQLTLALFGPLPKSAPLYETPTPLIGNCLTHALTDFAERLLRQLGSTEDQPRLLLIDQPSDDTEPAPGKGTLHVELSFEGLVLYIILPGPLAKAALRHRPVPKSEAAVGPLADPMSAILQRKVPVTATLGQASIDIGTLQSVEVGDVIRFQTRVDQPVSLQTKDGSLLCTGFLGTRDNYKSLQLQR